MAELEVIDDAARWDALTAATGFSPWQQSRAYGLALAAAGHAVGRWRIDVGGATVGCVQAVGRLAAGGRIGVWHALGGPMWRPGVGAVTKRAGLDALSAELGGRLRPILVTPALAAARTPVPADAGGRRLMTGYTTALLPVAASAERQAARFHAGWRGALKRGLGAGLEIACRDARSDLAGGVRAHLAGLQPGDVPVTYGALARALGLWAPGSVRRVTRALETTMREDAAADRPFIAARVVSRGRDRLPGEGFFELARALSRGPAPGEAQDTFHAGELERLERALAEGGAGRDGVGDRAPEAPGVALS